MSDFQFVGTFPASPETNLHREPDVGLPGPEMATDSALLQKKSSPELDQPEINPAESTPTEIFIQVDPANEPDTVQDQQPAVPQASSSASGDSWSGATAPAPSTQTSKVHKQTQ